MMGNTSFLHSHGGDDLLLFSLQKFCFQAFLCIVSSKMGTFIGLICQTLPRSVHAL